MDAAAQDLSDDPPEDQGIRDDRVPLPLRPGTSTLASAAAWGDPYSEIHCDREPIGLDLGCSNRLSRDVGPGYGAADHAAPADRFSAKGERKGYGAEICGQRRRAR